MKSEKALRMASLQFFFLILHFSFLIIFCTALKPSPKPYIVYMGSASNVDGDDDLSHLQLLSSLIPSEEHERSYLLHSYNHAFRGFSAMLTENEASIISGHDEVVSVFPDPVLQLHTTRSWDFLEQAAASRFRSELVSEQINSADHVTVRSDVIIGIIDTGIRPESESFNDHGIGKIPSKWKGECMESFNFKKSYCNRKLIGARFYHNQNNSDPSNTPRDSIGHGTHTASIAGGSTVSNASYYGFACGQARGGLPSARIASYRACGDDGCDGSSLLKAVDDAVKDGVDIISISIGRRSDLREDFVNDPIAIGAFHARQKGVLVVCSAGNEGPTPYTVSNTAPWIFTAAASTMDRDFQSTIVLGNNVSYKGNTINFSPLTLGKRYPLVFAERVAARGSRAVEARNCNIGSLDRKKAAGKIVVCMSSDENVGRGIKKLTAQRAKAKGVIIISEQEESTSFDSGTYPVSEVERKIGTKILRYIKSTKNPTATILATREVRNYKPAPVVASFSSRGPDKLTENILKPDITAPGVNILAAIVPIIRPTYNPPNKKAQVYAIRSGTSMSCPHVAGAAAFIKSVHPHWSSSIIQSALMTTASSSNNMGKPLTNTSRLSANPHEVGAGEINPIRALYPGLAFETSVKDHLHFLCFMGYKQKDIRSISSYKKFTCPKRSNQRLISNINYPSISIGGNLNRPKRVKRTVTNMGYSPNVTYISSVNAPHGLLVKVVPERLVFSEGIRRVSFVVLFDGKRASKGYNFGDIRWSDGLHNVRMVFAVNV